MDSSKNNSHDDDELVAIGISEEENEERIAIYKEKKILEHLENNDKPNFMQYMLMLRINHASDEAYKKMLERMEKQYNLPKIDIDDDKVEYL